MGKKASKGKKYHHPELNKDVLFSMSGIEHTLSNKLTIPKAALILQAEGMLKNSKHLLTEDDKLGRKEIAAVHKMAAEGMVEGEKMEILITLREGQNGVVYYDHEIDGIKKLPSTSVGLKSPTVKRSKEVICAEAQCKDTKKTNTTKKGKFTSGLKGTTSKQKTFKRKKSNWKSTRQAWQDVAKKTGLHHSQVKSKHTASYYVWNVIPGLNAPRKSKALTECEKKLPDYEIVKKKNKPTSSKKEFVVTIPIESIIYDFDTKTIDKEKVKSLVSSGTNKIEPLKVYQDPKDNKIYLLKGREELEALIKLNEENAPVVFSKTAPKKLLNGYIQTETLSVKDESFNLSQSEINKELVSVYSKLNNKKVTNLETGRIIVINKVGKGKQLYSRVKFDSKTATAIKNLLQLLEYAKLINEAKPKAHHVKKHRATKILNFEAKIIIDGKAHYFVLTVLENERGHLKYFVQPSEIKKSIRARSNKAKKQFALPNGQRKNTKKSNTTKKGLKSPALIEEPQEPTITLQPEPQPPAQQDRGGQVAPEAPVKPKNKKT